MRRSYVVSVLVLAFAGVVWPTVVAAGEDLTASAAGAYTPPPCEGLFADVPCSAQFAAWIEQFARDGITSGCTASNYCPDAAVTRRQMAVFVERAMRGTAAWQAHTVEVFAVRSSSGGHDDAASGQALLDGVAAIPTSGSDVPSVHNPWVVRVGPGTYDLGTATLQLPSYVTLEGAGREATVITSEGTPASPATVKGATHTTIRAVEVEATGASAVAIEAAAYMTIEDAAARGDGQTSSCAVNASGTQTVRILRSTLWARGLESTGLLADGATALFVRDVDIDVVLQDDAHGSGVAMADSGFGTFERVTVDVVSTGSANAWGEGFRFGGTAVSIFDSRFQGLTSGPHEAIALYITHGSPVEVRRCKLVGSRTAGATGTAIGVAVDDAYLTLEDSFVEGADQGLLTRRATAGRYVRIHNTTLGGDTSLVNGASFSTYMTGTRFMSAPSNSGSMECAGVWGPGTAFRADTCP